MVTQNVVLTDQQKELIDRLVADGRFQNASEAIRAGVRLLEAEEGALQALRERLSLSVAQAERGEFVEGTPEEIFARAMERAKARVASE